MSNQTGNPNSNPVDRVAFEAAVSPHYDFIIGYCIANLGDSGADIAQEVIMKAFKAWNTFEDLGAGPKPWLKTIARNSISTQGAKQTKIIKKTKFLTVDEDGVAQHGYENIDQTNGQSNPETQILAKLDSVDINLAFEALEDEFREVAILKFKWGWGNKEIAEELGINQNTVGTRVSRSRAKLTLILKDLARTHGIGINEDKKK